MKRTKVVPMNKAEVVKEIVEVLPAQVTPEDMPLFSQLRDLELAFIPVYQATLDQAKAQAASLKARLYIRYRLDPEKPVNIEKDGKIIRTGG